MAKIIGGTTCTPMKPIGGGGSVEVDDHLDTNSTNPVQNKVVAEEVESIKNDVGQNTTLINSLNSRVNAFKVDGELSDTSTNAVQNKAVAEAIGNLNNRLYGIEQNGGGGGSIEVDDKLDDESINPVQNKVVTEELNSIREYADTINEIAVEAHETATDNSDAINIMSENVNWLMGHQQAIEELQGYEKRISDVEEASNTLVERVGDLGNSVQSIETQVIPEHNERISDLENNALTLNDVDAELSATSEKPVQNKAVMQKISQMVNSVFHVAHRSPP